MDDVEEPEWTRAVLWANAQEEMKAAKAKFEQLCRAETIPSAYPKPCRPMGAERSIDDVETHLNETALSELAPQVLPPVVVKSRPLLGCTPSTEAKVEAFINLVKAEEVVQATEQLIETQYEEEGRRPFDKVVFTLKRRMLAVMEAKKRRERSEKLAANMKKKVGKYSTITDLYALTTCVEVATGKSSTIVGEDGKKTKREEKKWKRSIKPECRGMAADWMRHYVRSKNMRLSADEVSHATINRYSEQLCDEMDMDLESKAFLIKSALTMVPVPLPEDFASAMVVHCPAAEKLRDDLTALRSSVF